MNLPVFLEKIDKLTAKMSQDELGAFVHEIARKLPEEERYAFHHMLKTFDGLSDGNEERTMAWDDGYELLNADIKDIQYKLWLINEEELCLVSRYNEEWDDWYNSDDDEILFSDPEGVIKDINSAIRLLRKCVDMELYEEGRKLAEMLSELEVSVLGDYNDLNGAPMGLIELYRYSLLAYDFKRMLQETLYLTYMGNALENRANELYSMMTRFHCQMIKLEEIMQTGNHELPEFDEFLTLWILYLGAQGGKFAEELLKDAQSLIQDDSVLLENARKFVNLHPVLFEQLLRMGLDSDESSRMLKIGMEALDKIPAAYVVRSKVAILTAEYASRLQDETAAEKCWVEAFRSESSVINYMRIRFLTHDWFQYAEEVKAIYERGYSESKVKSKIAAYEIDREREYCLHRNEYFIMLFFDKEFDRVFQAGLSEKEAVGWSATFMKQGLALYLLLLYNGIELRAGIRSMLNNVSSECKFTVTEYVRGSNRSIEKSDDDMFWELFCQWKKQVQLSDNKRQEWLTKIDKKITLRVTGIMDGNHRSYYGKCASYIAALGEVQESNGLCNAKSIIMERYKKKYTRRRAFHEVLRMFGMHN